MKVCPICGATATDDALVCYECLYDWTRLSCDAIQPEPCDSGPSPDVTSPREAMPDPDTQQESPRLDGYWVVVEQVGEEPRRFSLASGSLHVGRLPTNDIVLNDRTVSRRHLHIFYEGGQFWVEDFGALNPTRVNGSAVVGRAPVCEGDEITVRSARLRISR